MFSRSDPACRTTALADGKAAEVCYLDIGKVFDSVSQQLFMQKMETFIISGESSC